MPPHGTEPISLICVGLEKEKKKTALKTLFLLSICHDESPLFRSLLLRLTCLCLFLTCCLPQRACACPQLVCVCAGRALPHGTALESTVPRLQCQCLEEDQIYSVSASLFLWRLESQPENSLGKTPGLRAVGKSVGIYGAPVMAAPGQRDLAGLLAPWPESVFLPVWLLFQENGPIPGFSHSPQ